MSMIDEVARAVRVPLMGSVALGSGVVVSRLVQAWALAALVAAPLAGSPWDSAVWAAAVAAAMVVVRSLLLWASESLAESIGHRVAVTARRRLLDHLLTLGPAYTATRRTGDVAATLVESAAAIETLMARARPARLLSWIGPLLAAAAVAVVDPLGGVLIAMALVVMQVAGPIWNAIGRKGHERVFTDLHAMDAGFVEAVQGMATAKSFAAAPTLRRRLAEQAETVRVASMRTLAVLFTQILAGRWASAGAGAVAVVRAGYLAADGRISGQAALAVLLVVLVAFVPVEEAGAYLHATFAARAAVAKLDAFLAEEPAVRDGDRRPVPLGPAPVVALEDVSFRYPGRDEDAVSGVGLVLEPGRTVALVGPSGSGKSTVVSLLARLVDPTAGRVTVDGRDLRELPLEQWWRTIAVVSQDTHLFPGTIRENIALARPDATREQIESAAEAAGLAADLAAMPDGYDTEVSERGARLSGGQRQRVAIARALLQDAPVLILDEATAALDGRTETAVHAAVERLCRDRAVLIVAHRLATVRDADEIVVLEQGRVVERGSHERLLGRTGTYHRLVEAGAAL
ncbi:ABC transporter ATP-binding protein [Nonomuraea sp. SYSU D8015]|uniref:ABC transporter ATP-binding protein n=1 Tax=Nonomuraea sp. SYSU D8015 TaxID=2593644 RepID=UPI001660812B|nr:ABC transporter ATP-binding protein [Nonomuraea sp. SYSU D8015]